MKKTKFDNSIVLCRDLFLGVLPTNDSRIGFLEKTLLDNDHITKWRLIGIFYNLCIYLKILRKVIIQ